MTVRAMAAGAAARKRASEAVETRMVMGGVVEGCGWAVCVCVCVWRGGKSEGMLVTCVSLTFCICQMDGRGGVVVKREREGGKGGGPCAVLKQEERKEARQASRALALLGALFSTRRSCISISREPIKN